MMLEMTEKQKQIQKDFDSIDFIPALYNKTYYSSVMQDEAALIDWQSGPLDKFLRRHLLLRGMKSFPWMFDAGCGPAVHHLFSLAKYTKMFHLADFMPENIAEIQKWVAKQSDAHDWDVFAKAILSSEGILASTQAIASREREVRKKIGSYSNLDLKRRVAPKFRNSAPLVTSYFVADSATRSKNVFARMTRNAFEIVADDGVFISAYLGNCSRYLVGRKWLPCASVAEDDIRYALENAGAKKVTIWRFDTPEMQHEGFDHIFAAIAEK